MLASAGLSNNPLFFHSPGQETLPQSVVYLMGSGVKQVLSFDEDLRPAAMPSEPFGKV
jgi:hypothetical protein